MKIKLFASIVIVLMSMNAIAKSSKGTVIELMEKTGATAQFKHMDALINAQIEEKKSSFENEEDFEKFVSIMQAGFNSKDAEKYVIEYFELNTNEDSLKEVIAIYNSPLLEEITKIEVEANDPSKQQEQIAFFQGLNDNPPSQERIQQLVTLDNVLGTSEMSLKMVQNMVISIAKGANGAQPKENQIPLNELEQKITSALPPNFAQQITNQIIGSFMYTYKDVSDEKLNEYIKVWKTPLGQYYTQKTLGALDYAFSKMGKAIGNSLKEF